MFFLLLPKKCHPPSHIHPISFLLPFLFANIVFTFQELFQMHLLFSFTMLPPSIPHKPAASHIAVLVIHRLCLDALRGLLSFNSHLHWHRLSLPVQHKGRIINETLSASSRAFFLSPRWLRNSYTSLRSSTHHQGYFCERQWSTWWGNIVCVKCLLWARHWSK